MDKKHDHLSPSAEVNSPTLWLGDFPDPDGFAHKYERGKGLFFGGADMTGATCLSAYASTRAGLGLAEILSPASALDIYKNFKPHIIVQNIEAGSFQNGDLNDSEADVVVIGPGYGQDKTLKATVINILKTFSGVIVLDADALTCFASDRVTLYELLHSKCVLTPHEGEFSQIFDDKRDKVTSTSFAAAQTGAVIVHKGSETVISAGNGRVLRLQSGSAYLATAGTGDVLAGMIAGLAGQGMPAYQAASAAVWMHSEAAENFGRGLVSADLPDLLPTVLQSLEERKKDIHV